MTATAKDQEATCDGRKRPVRLLCLAVVVGEFIAITPALSQPGPDGYDWVTVGATGNGGYDRADRTGRVTGRGALNYEYRMGRTEVTTAQWVEFFNAYRGRETPIDLPFAIYEPGTWGAELDPEYSGPGFQYRVSPSIPNAAMLPAGGMPWYTGAVLCNWLHNDKRMDVGAFLNGAYDVSQFGGDVDPVHQAGARYWLPTLDERLKAVYYDPAKSGPGQGGWWLSPNGTDLPIAYGPPGEGQANAGFSLPGNAQFRIPLGAYPQTASPWGLLDASGATTEWLETVLIGTSGTRYRMEHGSSWTDSWADGDRPDAVGGRIPEESGFVLGFRLASVPSPAGICVLGIGLSLASHRRRHDHAVG